MKIKEIDKGVVEYNIEVLFHPGKTPVEYCSHELWQRIVRYNTPAGKKIFFSKRQSMTEEINNDYNYKSLCRRYREATGEIMYAKQFVGFDFWYRETEIPVPVEKDAVVDIQFTGKTKTVAGYYCEEAKVIMSSADIVLWFTKEISLNSDTPAFFVIEGIEGMIMEWVETPAAKENYFSLRYTVTNISEITGDDPVFIIPPGYLEFEDSDAVKIAAFRLLREKKMQDAARPAMIAGEWLFKSASDNSLLMIGKNKNGNGFSMEKRTWQDGMEDKAFVEAREAFFTGNDLVVGDENDFYLLQHREVNGKWCLKENEIFSYWKS